MLGPSGPPYAANNNLRFNSVKNIAEAAEKSDQCRSSSSSGEHECQHRAAVIYSGGRASTATLPDCSGRRPNPDPPHLKASSAQTGMGRGLSAAPAIVTATDLHPCQHPHILILSLLFQPPPENFPAGHQIKPPSQPRLADLTTRHVSQPS